MNTGSNIYGQEFFAKMFECREAYLRLGDCIARVAHDFGGRVIDIGCGLGYVLEVFQDCAWQVLGADEHGFSEFVPIVKCDLAQVEYAFPERDVTICTETAEHLPLEAADNLVRLVCVYTEEMIIWSAAPPGQDADDPGHINLQPPEFWLQKFADRGWIVDGTLTGRLRASMRATHAQHEYCADNFHVLVPR